MKLTMIMLFGMLASTYSNAADTSDLCRHTKTPDSIEGTLVTNQEELNALRAYDCIEGDLSFRGGVETVDLPRLEKVTGSITFSGTGEKSEFNPGPFLTNIDLRNLVSVGGDLNISSMSYPQYELVNVDIGKLVSIGTVDRPGWLWLEGGAITPKLKTFKLPKALQNQILGDAKPTE